MRGALVCKGRGFGRATVEVSLTQPSSLPSEKNDLLFQDPRWDFELIVTTLSSHWENHRYTFYRWGPTFQGWSAVPCHHLAARDRSDTQTFPYPLYLLLSGISLLSFPGILSGFSSILSWHPHLSVHSPTSPCILLYRRWQPASENGSNWILQWVHFIFISRTAVWNICI